jgi:hypothetical protein
MRKLVATTGIAAGLLLMAVPRWILPPCEGDGHARMRCSDTARAEIALGGLLLGAGVLAFAAKRPSPLVADAAASSALAVLAWIAPDVYGYCLGSGMPCHYGMVPGVRFVAALAAVVQGTALLTLASGAWRRRLAR